MGTTPTGLKLNGTADENKAALDALFAPPPKSNSKKPTKAKTTSSSPKFVKSNPAAELKKNNDGGVPLVGNSAYMFSTSGVDAMKRAKPIKLDFWASVSESLSKAPRRGGEKVRLAKATANRRVDGTHYGRKTDSQTPATRLAGGRKKSNPVKQPDKVLKPGGLEWGAEGPFKQRKWVLEQNPFRALLAFERSQS